MSYADRLQKLVEYQNSIRTALTEKGATISSNSTFKDFPAAVGTITGDYNGPTPTEIMENGWGPYYSLVTNTTKIGSYAFANTSLSEANFPYCSVVGDDAFYSCKKLIAANFPECKSIMSGAFGYCNSLKSITAPKCEYMGSRALSECNVLKSVSFPKLQIGEDGFLYYCISLVSAYLPELTSCVGTFSWCSALRDVYIPKVSLLDGDVFRYCRYLSTLRLDNATKISCATYNPTFASCFNLRSLYLPASTVCSLTASQAFKSTPMTGYWDSLICTMPSVYGSIFVPYSLIGSYKTATNWAYYSSRIAGLVNFSATNLSESDTIVTVVDEKIFSSEMEIPSASFTYSVYSKYPKYTGTEADVGGNSSINIALPTDGVKLTVNTTPEDAVVTITENGFAQIKTKEKIVNVGETVLVEARKKYYKTYKSTVTLSEDKILNLEMGPGTLPEDITADNASEYSTWIDGENFEISDGFIRNGSKSYNVNNGFSVGFIKIYAEIDCKMRIKYKISSEYNHDVGIILVGDREYEFDKNSSTSSSLPEGFSRILKISDTLIKDERYTDYVALSAGEEYYIYFIYDKDSSSNYGDDRFYIRSVTFSK